MKEYRREFKGYLEDIAKKTPHPGGGSCAALNFCMGISLIRMALTYSGGTSSNLTFELEELNREVFPFIDEDGNLFALLINAKDKLTKNELLQKVQALIVTIGNNCGKIEGLAGEINTKVKKSLKSDFYIGLKFIESALFASIQNLEANQNMFSVDNTKKIDCLKSYLKKFALWLKV